jgi:hypothetical protein
MKNKCFVVKSCGNNKVCIFNGVGQGSIMARPYSLDLDLASLFLFKRKRVTEHHQEEDYVTLCLTFSRALLQSVAFTYK